MEVKQVLIIISALIVASYIGYNFGINQTGSFKSVIESQVEHHSPPSVVIEPGSAVETASYIVFHDDEGFTYAKNGDTGEIVNSDTDASTLINWAINQLTNGGKIFLKKGSYNVALTLNRNGITLEGESRGTVSFNSIGTSDIITLEVPSGETYLHRTMIKDINFEGDIAGGSGNGIISNIPTGTNHIRNLIIENCEFNYFTGPGKYALYLENIEESKFLFNRFVGTSTTSSAVKFITDGYYAGNVLFMGNSLFPSGPNQIMVDIEGINLDFVGFDSIQNHFTVDSTYSNVTAYRLKGNGAHVMDFYSAGDRFERTAKAFEIAGSGIGSFVHTVRIEGAYIYNPNFDNTKLIRIGGYTFDIFVEHCSFEGGNSLSNLIGVSDEGNGQPIYIHNNHFGGFSGTGSIPINRGTYTSVRGNAGYVTENSGVAYSIIDGTWVGHDLVNTPTIVTLTPRNNVMVWLRDRNSTHFQVGSTDIVTVDWYAEV